MRTTPPSHRHSIANLLSPLIVCASLLFVANAQSEVAVDPAPNELLQNEQKESQKLPGKMRCQAVQTAGLHDYAGAPESYEASTFFESKFELRINKVLTRHLAGTKPGLAEATPDLFLTLLPDSSSQGSASPVELRCRQVRGQSGELGYSCRNTPPSELLLINPANLRFTRASIGGWTFSDAPRRPRGQPDLSDSKDPPIGGNPGEHLGDDSLFVEFGTCTRR